MGEYDPNQEMDRFLESQGQKPLIWYDPLSRIIAKRDATYRFFKNGKVSMYLKGKTVGKMMIQDLHEKSSFIVNLEVPFKYRNKGYGTILMNKVMEYIKEAGGEGVALHCAVQNEMALKFYRRLGFFIAYITTNKAYYTLAKKL